MLSRRNGTQHIFESDDRVLFISLHQDNNYPPKSGCVSLAMAILQSSLPCHASLACQPLPFAATPCVCGQRHEVCSAFPCRSYVAEQGMGKGEGFTINVPLPPGSSIGAYRCVGPCTTRSSTALVTASIMHTDRLAHAGKQK
jgi:hypothetical protein